ncbi:hypothetical protein [Rhizobium leguminosarum]|uniref:hypothetical protein n=1 Tax=Rhizobium leguminosarum TaxID=384 RepID=UPI00102F9077|nr:hypothetical protein [Rhizobium leguminosarum]TAY14022.1 hypothetical protein ELH96_20715 [Rhizobium leguminosarum]
MKRLATLFFLISFVPAHSEVQISPCPGVDPTSGSVRGEPLKRIASVTSSEEDRTPVPPAIAKAALNIVGRFESGGLEPWRNVNGTDVLSIGFSQWNVNAGSLYSNFFRNLPEDLVSLSDPAVRSDIRDLREAANGRRREQFDAIIDRWTTSKRGDPVVQGIRRSLRDPLQSWLGSSGVVDYQVKLIEPNLRQAYSYARKWASEAGWGNEQLPKLTAYFFDLQIYNGGRKGLWRHNVTDLRAKLGSRAASVKLATDWLSACSAVSIPGNLHTKMYGRNDADKNIKLWNEDFMNEQTSEVGIEMLLFGYLRATISDGSNRPKGFHGIYAADVLNRRGTIALGEGWVHDTKFVLFEE